MTGSSEPTVPEKGVLLGLDYGTKHIGVAVSTADQSIASPLENYTRRSEKADAQFLKAVADEYQAVGIVVGLPVHMSGDEGGKAAEARAFGAWVGEATGRPVCYWDERHTSAVAEAALMQTDMSKKKRKARLDMLAAQVMLRNFLETDDRRQLPGAI